jgi:hypothetical protein
LTILNTNKNHLAVTNGLGGCGKCGVGFVAAVMAADMLAVAVVTA